MRIAFDGTTLRPQRTGVGYYTEHLLAAPRPAAATTTLIVVSNRPIDTTAPLPRHVRIAAAASRLPRMAWMQMRRAARAAGARRRRRAFHERDGADRLVVPDAS